MAYPSLVITYLGQAAYLMVNPDNYATTFYSCIPSPVYWPVFVVAVLAAIVASQVWPPSQRQHWLKEGQHQQTLQSCATYGIHR